MRALVLAVVLPLAGSGDSRVPSRFPIAIAGFQFGDSFAVIRGRCEKLGVIKGRSRFELSDDGRASCEAVALGKPYLPRLGKLWFAFDRGKLKIMGVPMELDRLTAAAREMVERIGESAKIEDGIYCVGYDDGTGSTCVDLTRRWMSFASDF